MISRRGLLLGLGALAAPAVVHYGNLMPVRSIKRLIVPPFISNGEWIHIQWIMVYNTETGNVIVPLTPVEERPGVHTSPPLCDLPDGPFDIRQTRSIVLT
jgi:hypothetical protein